MSDAIDTIIGITPLIFLYTTPIWLAVLRRYDFQWTPVRRRGFLFYIGRKHVE